MRLIRNNYYGDEFAVGSDFLGWLSSVITVLQAVYNVLKVKVVGNISVVILGLILVVLIILSQLLKNEWARRAVHDFKPYRMFRHLFSNYSKQYDCILKKRLVHYEYIDRETICHYKIFEVIPKREGFDRFRDRYLYTGDTKCKLKAPIHGQKIVDRQKYYMWSMYSIKLNSPCSKGKPIEMKMEMDTITDKNHTAQPFLSTGIYEPTKFVHLEVKFGESILPYHPQLKIYRNYIDESPFITKPLTFDPDNRMIEYKLSYPIHYYKYQLEWSFDR